jgi:hypothetical protein
MLENHFHLVTVCPIIEPETVVEDQPHVQTYSS